MISEFAPAKVNLALHVTAKRGDGFHLVDSLVVFADIGDHLSIETAARDQLEVTGLFAAGVPVGPENLVWKAANLFPDRPPLKITLEKNLPPASGIGGGTSDGAAIVRGLVRLLGREVPKASELTSLGADLPVCVTARPSRMAGIGEVVEPITNLPPFNSLLINPGVEVSTARVFGMLSRTDGKGLSPFPLADDRGEWLAYLHDQRNDMAMAAQSMVPKIGEALQALAGAKHCQLARMSGSGATVFGLFPDANSAAAAGRTIADHHKDWWIAPTMLVGSGDP